MGMDLEYRFIPTRLGSAVTMTLKHCCFPAAAAGCHYLSGNRWKNCPGKKDQVFVIGSLGFGSWGKQACFHSASVSPCKMAGNLAFQSL